MERKSLSIRAGRMKKLQFHSAQGGPSPDSETWDSTNQNLLVSGISSTTAGDPGRERIDGNRLLSGKGAVHGQACRAESASAPVWRKFELRNG
jgi:hypothetical protein